MRVGFRGHDARVSVAKPATRARRKTEKRAGWVSVCLCGPATPVPRYLGDNRGGWPVFLIVTAKERQATKQDDLRQPYQRFVVLEHVKVETRVHGERLKHALDVMLLGEQTRQGNDQPRHKFRDVWGCFDDDQTLSVWWGTLLDAARREVGRMATRFEIAAGCRRPQARR